MSSVHLLSPVPPCFALAGLSFGYLLRLASLQNKMVSRICFSLINFTQFYDVWITSLNIPKLEFLQKVSIITMNTGTFWIDSYFSNSTFCFYFECSIFVRFATFLWTILFSNVCTPSVSSDWNWQPVLGSEQHYLLSQRMLTASPHAWISLINTSVILLAG